MSPVDQGTGSGHRDEVFVPVAIDADRTVDDIDMVRATYFVITTDAPALVWEIELPPLVGLHGLGVLGMLGIVFSTIPPPGVRAEDGSRFELFTNPDQIAAIFALEQEGGLSIQLEDLWLPKAWCVTAPEWGQRGPGDAGEVQRGDVFRVEVVLFQDALRYSIGDITVDRLVTEEADGRVFRSPVETAALRGWAQDQIEQSKRAFPDKELKLRARY